MSSDRDEAIEKLAEYHKDSEVRKQTKSKKKRQLAPYEISIRNFFLKFYWFNAAIYFSIGLLLFFGMKYTPLPQFIDLIIGIIAFVFLFQIFQSISRLERSVGSDTSIDEVFNTLLLFPIFLIFRIFSKAFLGPAGFFVIYILLIIVWILQIYFVNFLKPEFDMVTKRETTEHTRNPIVDYFTTSRIITLISGAILTIIILLLQA